MIASRVLLAFALALGCAARGVPRQELSQEPLAIVYLSEDEATRRVEMLERARQANPQREGHARFDDVAKYLGFGRTSLERQAEAQGHLALLDPRTQAVEKPAFAVRGARPLDWSPDGSRLLFVSPGRGGPQIIEYDRTTGDLREITRGPELHPSACYGPDGRIAYVEVRQGPSWTQSRIWVTDAGGAQPQPLTMGPSDSSPAWSPDGEVLLYVTDAPTRQARIVAVSPAAPAEPRFVASGRAPAFTPDGAWVVYSATTAEGWRLRRMRPDGSGKLRIGESGPENEHWPTVSPDGRFVAYVAETGLRQQLRVRALDGSGDRPLLERGDGAQPVWN